MAFHVPERYFSRITDIDIDWDLLRQGYDNVLLDVDNTILARDTSTVPADVSRWLDRARDNGINFCLVSNDWHANVVELSHKLELPIVVKSLKPLPHAFLKAMKKIGARRSNTVMVGDQLMTDVFGAHFIGLPAYLLVPLVKQDLKHTLFLRKFEKIILNGRCPEPATIVRSD